MGYPPAATAVSAFAALALSTGFWVTSAAHSRSSSVQARRAPEPAVRPVAWSEAAPIVQRLADALPASLQAVPAAQRSARWLDWVAGRRQAIQARLDQGDADSLVNLLLFGTTFTAEPRITARLLEDLNSRWQAGDRSAQEILTQAYRRRAADLVRAMSGAATSERLRSGRRIIERLGHDLATEAGRLAAADDLLVHVIRVRQEAAALAEALERARALPDSTAAFAEQSRVFRDRGLAPDSSVLTQFAVDRALCTLAEREAVPPRSITRVAIVGPGLDFADKQEGFDFYDLQSLQPFLAVDSLRQCGLAANGPTTVTTIDVSDRVNAHLRAARAAADTGGGYRLVLPRDENAGWTAKAVEYWSRAGARIGVPLDRQPPPLLRGIRTRALAVRPDVVRALTVVDGNVVLDRLGLADGDRFDLVVATNVLVYYDTFEQALAAASIAAMLRPGGILLANTALLEIPEIPLRSAGYVTVPFSAGLPDGEHMVWYRRSGS